MKRSLESFSQKNEYPYKDSLLARTLDAEIKRVAEEREEPRSESVRKLARFVGVHERTINNYRMGKCPVPEDKILLFCKQFRSVALAVAWLESEAALDETEELDLVQLASRTCQLILGSHSTFLRAFDDGKVDGFEMNELRAQRAAANAGFNRLLGIAEANYQRRSAL